MNKSKTYSEKEIHHLMNDLCDDEEYACPWNGGAAGCSGGPSFCSKNEAQEFPCIFNMKKFTKWELQEMAKHIIDVWRADEQDDLDNNENGCPLSGLQGRCPGEKECGYLESGKCEFDGTEDGKCIVVDKKLLEDFVEEFRQHAR